MPRLRTHHAALQVSTPLMLPKKNPKGTEQGKTFLCHLLPPEETARAEEDNSTGLNNPHMVLELPEKV